MESNSGSGEYITLTGGTSDNVTITLPNTTIYPNTGIPYEIYEPVEFPIYPTFPIFFDPEKEEMKRKLDRMEKLLEEMAGMLERNTK